LNSTEKESNMNDRNFIRAHEAWLTPPDDSFRCETCCDLGEVSECCGLSVIDELPPRCTECNNSCEKRECPDCHGQSSVDPREAALEDKADAEREEKGLQ
jgi:hypothetical protein